MDGERTFVSPKKFPRRTGRPSVVPISEGRYRVGFSQALRSRWGTQNQAERFRAELANRRRKPGETAQSVYNDVRRLLSLGFPGETGAVVEVLGRDAFLTALNDPALRIRVLDQRPTTLDDALNAICSMEAYGVGNSNSDVVGADLSLIHI